MKQLYFEMADLASRKESFVLATVISSKGSVPRSLGAKMLIRQDGTSMGTVGGGILEAHVEQLARVVHRTHRAVTQNFEFNGKDATINGPICGGQAEVLVEWMDTNDPPLAALYASLKKAIESNTKIWLVSALPTDGAVSSHTLVKKDGSITGFLPSGLSHEDIIQSRKQFVINSEETSYFVDPLENTQTVFIFGAGHVSKGLAQFTKAVDFRTVVLDDRADYVTPQRFPNVDQLIALGSFSDAIDLLAIDRDSFLVILTRGHLSDRLVLTQALKTQAGYIGMMGSRRKCELIFNELRHEGFSEEDLRRVHAPIGLSIKADTPEEIGISIVAELVQARANLKE